MCKYQSLFYDNRIGYVVKCVQCNQFQLGYGTVIINCAVEDFYYFYQKICTYATDLENIDNLSSIKSIAIPTPCVGLSLFLSERELMELYVMLDTADSELKFQTMSNLVSPQA